MKKRLALEAACLILLTVTAGAFAAGKLYYNPFRDMTDSKGHILRAESRFSGEVKLYTSDERYIGSFGTDGPENAPITADVHVDGDTIHLSGMGRHILRTTAGELVGYADLNPESADERARLRAAHEKALGHETTLPISSGSDDGWGTAIGFFGNAEDNKLLTWRLTGTGEARFLHDGKVVRSGIASPVTALEAATLRQTMPPARFKIIVRTNPPATPIFEWTQNGVTRRHVGTDALPLTLPDGTKITVRFASRPSTRSSGK